MTKPADSVTVPPKVQTVRLLLIEPEGSGSGLRDLIDSLAVHGFRIVHEFPSVSAAAAALDREAADLVLADIGEAGVRELDQLAAQPALNSYVPFIVIDHAPREDIARRALQAGAQDYLVKSKLTPPRIERAMRWSLERARIERDLKRESDLFHALLDYVPDAIYFKDRHGRFLHASASVARRLRVDSPADVIGKTDFHFYTPEVAEATFVDEQRVIETARPLIGKMERIEMPDGTFRWSSTTKLPLRNRHGRIIGTCGITRDVTDLKKLEGELAAERNMLRGLIDNLPDPIYVKDVHGRYVLDNAAHSRFLGVENQSDVIGKTVFDFFEPEFAEQANAVDEAVLRTGESRMNQEEQTSSAGKPTWLVTSKVPLRNEAGEITGLVCINRNVTEERNAKNALLAANSNLTAALADVQRAHQELGAVQLQLIEAEKSKSIGRLAAGVAHEVKNPLAIISMGVEFLSGKYGSDPTTASVLKELSDAVSRADTVIKGLLDFSPPRQVELQPQDLNAIIRSALALVRGEFRGDLHRVELDLDDIPTVLADRGKVSQVFVNLFTNAIQAMDGGGTISVRTRVAQITGVGANVGGERSEVFQAGDRVVVVEVADTGPGIPPELLARVFEPFFTTKPTGKGTGLGMSVVKSIMNLQRGTVRIANRDGGGAVVTLTFKAHDPT
ncbi:MAG: PAS domain-containing protein [Terrimicrobiaceae bacterium]|nr:PAS domain-containing protein [Terrimicrobiaceae bacterium]